MEAPTNSYLIEADESLATVFSHFYCVAHSPQAPPVFQQLLPNYEMLLAFNFGPPIPASLGDDRFIIRQKAVLGPLQKTLSYELPPGADLIVVNFTLNGFYRLLRVPMHQLKADELYHPDKLLNKTCFSDIWEQLAPITDLEERLRILSAYASAYAAPLGADSETLLESIPHFRNSTVDPIKALAHTRQLSTRSIQLRFQKQLGYSAKELVRFLRFRQVLDLLCRTYPATVDWQDLVLRFGYHDHSHLIKDFQFYVDVTPRGFLRRLARGEMCMSKPGKFY